MSDRRSSYLSPPQMHVLDIACIPLHVFGIPYLVGSVNFQRDFRDVDVRLILDDSESVFGLDEEQLRALDYVISRYLTEASGLPIDFQFQSTSDSKKYEGVRNPLGTRWSGVLPEVVKS